MLAYKHVVDEVKCALANRAVVQPALERIPVKSPNSQKPMYPEIA